jgi:hypothetical protein
VIPQATADRVAEALPAEVLQIVLAFEERFPSALRIVA